MTKLEALIKQLEEWEAEKAKLLERVTDLDFCIVLIKEGIIRYKEEETRQP